MKTRYAIIRVIHDALGRETQVQEVYESEIYTYLEDVFSHLPGPTCEYEYHLTEKKRGAKYKSFQNGHLYKLKGESND